MYTFIRNKNNMKCQYLKLNLNMENSKIVIICFMFMNNVQPMRWNKPLLISTMSYKKIKNYIQKIHHLIILHTKNYFAPSYLLIPKKIWMLMINFHILMHVQFSKNWQNKKYLILKLVTHWKHFITTKVFLTANV